MRWSPSKYANLVPLLAFLAVLAGVLLIDRARGNSVRAEERQAEVVAERGAGSLADMLGNELAVRIGSLAAAELQFTSLEDSLSRRSFMSALDTVTRRLGGLMAISVIYPATGRVLSQDGSVLRAGGVAALPPAISDPYRRALSSRQLAASGVLEGPFGRRVLVFSPVERGDTVPGVLVAELEPQMLYHEALVAARLDTVRAELPHTVYGPDGVAISPREVTPRGWQTVSRRLRVADTHWTVVMAYQPPDPKVHRAERIALWVAGTSLGAALALVLLFLRRTIATQREEIARRQAAEDAARNAAAEARRSAREARDLAAQLEAAQRAAQRLSTSLDPDGVVELFLGGVAEILDADVASLYTFEEGGELVVGRKRMVLREIEGVTERLQREDMRAIRAPVALLPHLAEPVATGEPYVRQPTDASAIPDAGGEPAAQVSVPLLIAGHTVGVASWEVYARRVSFMPAAVTFAQALAAPAAAALPNAELFASLEAERLRAEDEALRFAAVLDQMADGVVVVDSAGGVERSNKAASELLGEDLLAAPLDSWPERFALTTPDGRAMGRAEFPLARALRGERVRRSNFIVRSPWGTERHLSSSAGPIRNEAGESAGAAMVLRDVSDEHHYAEMLRHTNRELRRQADMLEEVNRQLREATRAKDQFLAVMSHELRTPINAIMGYSDLLDLGVKGALNQEQRAMLDRVRETSRHLLGLINEVLDLAKIGAGRIELVIAELPVQTVIERALKQVLPMAAEKGIRLEVNGPPPEQPIIVAADETRLTQIVINLLSNAVKFTQQGSVTLGYREHREYVEISVRDTGPGIPQEQQDRIFEEFYQVEGGLSRASGGTGLGLSIARRFARLMNGDITVESAPGEGANFSLRIPHGTGRARVAEPSAPAVVVLGHSGAVLQRLEQDLADEVTVLGTTDAMQVAVLVREYGAVAAALDVGTPDAGAWRALASLQADGSTRHVRSLLFAPEGDHGALAQDLGEFITLPKPISVRLARELVAAASHGRHTGSRVLVLDDDPHVLQILTDALSAGGCRVETFTEPAAVLRAVRAEPPDVLLLDLLSHGAAGLEMLACLRADPALAGSAVLALLAPELSLSDLERLDRTAASLARGHRARTVACAELVRALAATAVPVQPIT